MSQTPQNHHPGKRMERLDALLKEIEQFKDEQSARTTREIIHLLMDLHGSALERILELIAPRNRALIDELAEDELISSLLVLYGLHPLDVEARLARALARIHCDAEVLGISDGIARIRTHGDFPSKETIEQAVYDHVSDLNGVEIVAADRLAGPERFALPILGK